MWTSGPVAILFVLVGLAFKLSVFPFHFWCPDAFEGRLLPKWRHFSPWHPRQHGVLCLLSSASLFSARSVFKAGQPRVPSGSCLPVSRHCVSEPLAAATATFGNLAAYSQSNMKRMLAYSTIAHAGYMLMAVAAMMVILLNAGLRNDTTLRNLREPLCGG